MGSRRLAPFQKALPIMDEMMATPLLMAAKRVQSPCGACANAKAGKASNRASAPETMPRSSDQSFEDRCGSRAIVLALPTANSAQEASEPKAQAKPTACRRQPVSAGPCIADAAI